MRVKVSSQHKSPNYLLIMFVAFIAVNVALFERYRGLSRNQFLLKQRIGEGQMQTLPNWADKFHNITLVTLHADLYLSSSFLFSCVSPNVSFAVSDRKKTLAKMQLSFQKCPVKVPCIDKNGLMMYKKNMRFSLRQFHLQEKETCQLFLKPIKR